MIGYITIGANDSKASGAFYDAVLGALGNERKFEDGGWIGYGPKGKDEHNVYLVNPPADGKPATFGNGMMISFKGHAKADVDAAYKAGMGHGGKDEGAPGPRPADSTTFYGAYMRDPVGNKICVYCKP
jgi:catechol 2,3-dioxygenase-like lactoylglutathione lyase family enzyme